MISPEEAMHLNHEQLRELMQKIRSVDVKLAEAKRQVRDWRNLEIEHQNEMDKLMCEARKLSKQLFGEEK